MSTRQAVLRVGMHCEGCSARISQVLEGSSGIRSLNPDLSSGSLRVEYYPEKISVEDLKKAISDLGYSVE